MYTQYHSKYYSHLLTLQNNSNSIERLSQSIFDAKIDLNPHQVEASLFAFQSPLQNGVILADEVGLGKTIEAGLVLCQYWSERKRKIIIIAPASLRKQWSMELKEKFFIDSIIIDGTTFKEEIKKGNKNPFIQDNKVVITSYPFASRKEEFIFLAGFQLSILDEAHKLRNFHRGEKAKQAYSINKALRDTKKLLLTATPLQNSLLEIYGLVSLIDPFVFGDKKAFQKQFNSGNLTVSDINDLKNRLNPIVHRTLRKDVLEYIKYTKRIPLVQEFTPTDDEITLYNLISEFLLNEELYSIPVAQRNLITLVARKLLASSTKAITGTLETMIKRLENLAHDERMEINQFIKFEDDEELIDEYLDEEDNHTSYEKIEIKKEDIKAIESEIEQLKSFIDIAKSIEVDTKVKALLQALDRGFEAQSKLGANKKSIIFTESKRTQEFLFEYLEDNGYKNKVVLFNGTNNDKKSKEIYNNWIDRYQETDRITGSKTADMKQAIVDYFKDEADILIATEAGSEGINLQFCNMLINYDLPWNPQRIEQRIGRVHRYGQKHDVVVINFLNKKNEADRRVYELLSSKFKLFEGVFGASDEVLGTIASGVDFEKRILQIYQTCRTITQIEKAFESLQDEFSSQINEKTLKTREQLIEHFDQDVHLRLKNHLEDMQTSKNKFEEYLHLISKIENIDLPKDVKFNSSIVQNMLETSISRELETTKLVFNLTNHTYKVSTLEPYKNKSGFLLVTKVTIDSYDTEEYLVVTALTNDYKKIDDEVATKLFSLEAKQSSKTHIDNSDIQRLKEIYQKQKDIILESNEQTNSEHFSNASIKLHKWSDDKLNEINKELKETKAKVKELNRQSSSLTQIEEIEKIQLAIKEQERKRKKIQREIFDIEDEIENKRDELIEELKLAKKQEIKEIELFICEWEIK
ncbi:SNF2-related protein [Arcobacter peruensis]|uniref:SNF2-related protein n=1 Tax=Arcobacter peruensis TaxID=2320140 RepID=UPI0013DEA3F6|nr:SNF2-related protein [Arcobacter peruensis]